ncbi:uncharacterized protein [Notamacropus eugenii]|uniref:uncharacterized protein n=1 Tax=Notamacropus eugenii TaxID=9315 RepID=UPI003B66F602
MAVRTNFQDDYPSKKTIDQEHQKAKEEKVLEDSAEELKSIMATPPKEDPKPNDQEHQKAKEDSTIVPEGDKLEHAKKSLPQDDPWAASSIRIYLPLPKKLRRFLSMQIQKRAHPTARNKRQESPTLRHTPPAQELSERGRFHTTRKPQVIFNHQRMMPYACLYCGRVLRPYSCILTRMMSHLKILEKLRNHVLRYHLNRNFQNHPGECNQKKRGTLTGTQAQMKSSSLTNPLEWSTSLNRNYWNTSNEEEKGFTLMYESNGSKGPFHCPCCSETYNEAADFIAHLKIHSGIKVIVVVKPTFHLCPYCKWAFHTSKAILAHWCPSQ